MTPTFDEAIEEIMARGFKLGIAKLAPAERTIYVISNADFEINLGGASGYLYNSAGDNIDLLPFAFDTIGCFTLGSHARNLLKHDHCIEMYSFGSPITR